MAAFERGDAHGYRELVKRKGSFVFMVFCSETDKHAAVRGRGETR